MSKLSKNVRLEELKIQHYKGFFEEQSIEFAIPNGKSGSGLTLIVGPNNSGKTTVIESLLLDDNRDRQKGFTDGEMHQKHPPKVTIRTSNKKECIFSNNEGGSHIQRTGEPHKIDFDVIQSRRYWNYKTTNPQINTQLFSQQQRLAPIRDGRGAQVAETLKSIHTTRKEKEYTEFMKQIIPRFKGWSIKTDDDGVDYVSYRIDDIEHTAKYLGDGVISLLRIGIHFLEENQDEVLIIDEPELSLHPVAQKNLSRILSEKSKTKQIIICTHSPYFVNWRDFINGAHFVRMNKNGKECTSSIMLRHELNGYFTLISNNINTWKNSHFFDIVAKEILFTEKMLFVEGIEDVGLIKKWMSDNYGPLNFDIFGYGVGGYGNMSAFLHLANDLNLSKVACLYDSGKDADISHKKNKEKFKEYHFAKLPTEDIRDKYKGEGKIRKKIKEGCFSEDGEIKPEYEYEFENIMDDIIIHFSSEKPNR